MRKYEAKGKCTTQLSLAQLSLANEVINSHYFRPDLADSLTLLVFVLQLVEKSGY